MRPDELRSAALLFAPELASGRLSLRDLERPEVRRAVCSRAVPGPGMRAWQRASYGRGVVRRLDDSVACFAAARHAVLGAEAGDGPRFLVRVDEFPNYDSHDVPEHGPEAFERFHGILAKAGVPYLIATQAAVAADALNPDAQGSRPLTGREREVIARIGAEGASFALHGYDHRTRFAAPAARSELEGRPAADLDALLDRGLGALDELGIRPRVFVPPFNTFGAEQYDVLARRFAVVCGGPESIARMGHHRTPLWRGDAVYLPSYVPVYGHASTVEPAVERLVEEGGARVWVPLTLHWAWESDAGWNALERLAERLAPHAAHWDEFLADVDRSAQAVEAPPLHVVSVQTTQFRGGAEYANVGLLQALSERGAKVTLMTNQPELAKGTDVRAVSLELGPKLARRTLWRTARNFLPGVAKLARALGQEAGEAPIDAVLLHYKKEQLMGLFLPRGLARAIVWAEWGPLPAPLRSGFPRFAYLLAARRAPAIVAVSESTRRSLEEAGVPGRKILVVPPLVDATEIAYDAAARVRRRAEWGVGDADFVVGCVSRFHPAKPLDVVIDAVARLPEDVHLVMAGDGEDEERLRERARPLGERVHWLPTPRGYVQEVVSACDVQVFAPQQTEGLPRAIMFGQLTERPVIVTHEAPVAGIVPPGTGAAVEPPNDPAALAALLAAYRDDPERRRREGEAARRMALERYDVDRAVSALERTLRIAARRPPRRRTG